MSIRMHARHVFVGLLAMPLVAADIAAQTPATPAAQAAAPVPAKPPATKLEAFAPGAGSVVTIGYDEIGDIGGVSVQAREIRDGRRAAAGLRGLVVEVRQSQYREERAFVDADELPDLLKGMDALLDIKANPTDFKQFEVQYQTKGELQLTAFNNGRGQIQYAVQAGRGVPARAFMDAAYFGRLRELVAQAQSRIAAPAAAR